jgi:NADPH:quinone reductase-like Zn-dependent oxidoreductase
MPDDVMRALHVPAAGERPELSDLPIPDVGQGQILIRVKAAGLNPFDNTLASGTMAEMIEHAYPLVLGRDAAGVVEEVGPGVAGIAVGDEVFGHVLLTPPIQAGTLAGYAVLPAAGTAPKPPTLDWVTAAALPLAGAAATAAVDAVDPEPGQVVLVVGATGGVGSITIQLLAARGATVLATGAPGDTGRLTALGAAAVIDYTTAPVADQVRAAYPDGVDALVDLVAYAPDDLALTAVRKGGTVVSSLRAADEQALAAAGLTGINIMAMPTREVLVGLADRVLAGTLKIDVMDVLPLDRAADGLATLASGQACGKIVVRVGN